MNMELQNCSKCGIEKPLEDFCKNTNYATGFTKKCKLCTTKTNKENTWNKKNSDMSPLEHSTVDATNLETERILKKMGYELYNSDNPVHSQFNERIEQKYGINLES